ncbi:MAG: tryptophan-rich sensory protein [Janthinobacterium lividum]
MLFGRIRRSAAWLMVPYLAWLCYAGALTWGLGRLNPAADGLASPAASTQVIS